MRIKRFAAPLMMAAVFIASGCSRKTRPSGEPSPEEPKGEVVAEYRGGEITLEDVREESAFAVDPGVPMPIKVCSAPMSVTENAQFIASREWFLEQARKRGLDREDEFLSMVEEKKKKLLARAYRLKKFEEVTSDEAYEYHNHHLADFTQEDYYLYRNIFIQFAKESEEEREQAMVAAQAALEAVRSGEDFAAVERRFSTRPGEGLNQEFLMYGKTEMYPPIREALESMKPGDISEIIEARHGFMILKLVDHKPSYVRPFEEVEEFCRSRVSALKVEQELREEIAKRGIGLDEEVLFSAERQLTDMVAKGEGFSLTAKDVEGLPSPWPELSDTDARRVKGIVMEAVKEALLVEKAESAGITSDPEFQRQLEGFRKRALALLELDREIQERLEDSTMTEDEMYAHFEQYRDAFASRPETQIRVINIVSEHKDETRPDKIHFAWQTAEQTASELLERIQTGEDFAGLATAYSTGFNAAEGGLLPYEPYGPRGHVIDLAVEPLEIGEVTGPVRYNQGFYLIKLEDKIESTPMSFEEAKEDVQKDLFWTKAEQIQNETVDEACRRAGLVMKQEWGTKVQGVDAS